MTNTKATIRGILQDRRARWVLGALILATTFVCARVAVESGAAHRRGEAAVAAGDEDTAVFHFRTAAKWYLPFSPWVSSALEQLVAVGQRAEQREDWVFALHAYDSARSAILGSRSFYTPNQALLDGLNTILPKVMARARISHPHGPSVAGETMDSLEKRFVGAMEIDHAPHAGLSLILSLGFAVWFLALFVAIWRGVPATGGVSSSQIRFWGGLSVAGFLTWVIGLIALIYV